MDQNRAGRRSARDMRNRGTQFDFEFQRVMGRRAAVDAPVGSTFTGKRVATQEQFDDTVDALTRWFEQNVAEARDENGNMDPELLVQAANIQFNLYDASDPTDEQAAAIHEEMVSMAQEAIAAVGASVNSAPATPDAAVVVVADSVVDPTTVRSVGLTGTRFSLFGEDVDEADLKGGPSSFADKLNPHRIVDGLQQWVEDWVDEHWGMIKSKIEDSSRTAITAPGVGMRDISSSPLWLELAQNAMNNLRGRLGASVVAGAVAWAILTVLGTPVLAFIAFVISRAALRKEPALAKSGVIEGEYEYRTPERRAFYDEREHNMALRDRYARTPETVTGRKLFEQDDLPGEGMDDTLAVRAAMRAALLRNQGRRDGTVPAPPNPTMDTNNQGQDGQDPAANADPVEVIAQVTQDTAAGLSSQITGLNTEIAKQQELINGIIQQIQQLTAMGQQEGAADQTGQIASLTAQQTAEQGKLDAMNAQLQGLMAQLQSMNAATEATGGTPAAVPAAAPPAAAPPAPVPAPAPAPAPDPNQGKNLVGSPQLRAPLAAMLDGIKPLLGVDKRSVTKDQVQPVLDAIKQVQTQIEALLNSADAANNTAAAQPQTGNTGAPAATGTNNANAQALPSFLSRGAAQKLQDYAAARQAQPANAGAQTRSFSGLDTGKDKPNPLTETDVQQLLENAEAGAMFRTMLVEDCVKARVRAVGSTASESEATYRARLARSSVAELQTELATLQNIARQLFSTGRSVVPIPTPAQTSGNGTAKVRDAGSSDPNPAATTGPRPAKSNLFTALDESQKRRVF